MYAVVLYRFHDLNGMYLVYLKGASDILPRTLPQCSEYHYRHFADNSTISFCYFLHLQQQQQQETARVSAPMCWLLVVQITVEVDILGASTVSCLRIKWSFDLSDTVAFTLALPLCAASCSLVIEGLSRHTTFFIFSYLYWYSWLLTSANALVASVGSLFSGRFHRPYNVSPYTLQLSSVGVLLWTQHNVCL